MYFDMSIDNPIRLGVEEELIDHKIDNFCDYIREHYGRVVSRDDFTCELNRAGFTDNDIYYLSRYNMNKLDYFDLY